MTTTIVDTSGMSPVGGLDLASVCDDDLIPGTKASDLLKEAITECQREAFAIASAELDFDGTLRSGPFFSVLPRLDEAGYSIILVWRGSRNTTFMASTRQQIGRAHSELQSLMRISYAVFCLKKKNTTLPQPITTMTSH